MVSGFISILFGLEQISNYKRTSHTPKNMITMKASIFTFVLCVFFYANLFSQVKLVAEPKAEYFDWFHNRSQTSHFYQNNSDLLVFRQNVPVRTAPSPDADVLTKLEMGQTVHNIAFQDHAIPKDKLDGYNDIWLHVKGHLPKGQPFEGYVWGTHLARGWKTADITGDGQKELIMLGVSSLSRNSPKDINGELRIVKNGQLLEQKTLPGLCLFEECDNSTLLRILSNTPQHGQVIIEASTMTIGCWAAVEKTYLHWNGQEVELIYHGELISGKVYTQNPIQFSHPATEKTEICEYIGEDKYHNPKWRCRTIQSDETPTAVAVRE